MNHNKKYIAKKFRVLDKYIDLILTGLKKSTIRYGIVLVKDKFVTIESNKREIIVKISKIDYSKLFDDLDEKDAVNDGFKSLSELREKLKTFYPQISTDDPITIINFEKVR